MAELVTGHWVIRPSNQTGLLGKQILVKPKPSKCCDLKMVITMIFPKGKISGCGKGWFCVGYGV